ncbi:MAG: LysR family transcriptional regulator substrate-binding protein, partial [Pseudomonadota bacterium]
VLRIGILKIYARNLMSALISAYQDKYPGIQVVVEEGNAKEIIRTLLDDKTELGLIATASFTPPQLNVIPYFQEETILVLPNWHPLSKKKIISLKDLGNEALIVRERGATSREFIMEKYREAKIVPRILIEISNPLFIIEQVEAGKGIAFIAKSFLKEHLKRGSLKARPLAEGPFTIDIGIAHSKNRTLSPAARAFMELMIERKNGLISTKATRPLTGAD